MRNLQGILWAGALSAFLVGSASAQTTGTTTTGTTGTTTGSTTGTTGGATGTNPGAAAAAAAQQALQAPVIAAPSASTASSSVLNASNVFGRYYNNPYYQGRAGVSTGNSTASNTPGGFGAALYGTTGAGSSNTGSGSNTRTGGTTGATAGTASAFGGSTSGFGGNTGATAGRAGQQSGFGSTTNANSNQQNNGLSTGRQIAYTATLKFAAPSVTAPQMQIDLRGMLDTSSGIADAKAVSVTAAEGGLIVLKGNAKDEDEAKLIEGMIRLTPGVRNVQNELKFPPQ